MEDQGIIALFFDRSEQAIEETDKKYGGYCYSIAYNILSNREDSEESVSDTYLAAWNTIPPRRPNFLNAFLAKMTRHISIDRWRKLSAKKRGGGEIILALDELEECVDSHNVETELAKKELTRVLNMFLSSLTETERNVFLCRYWYRNLMTGEDLGQVSYYPSDGVWRYQKGNDIKEITEAEAFEIMNSYAHVELPEMKPVKDFPMN